MAFAKKGVGILSADWMEKKEVFISFIEEDPLYAIIKDTSLEVELFSDSYLEQIEEKRWYSTVDVAEWFGINDGQLRYYIKPFHEYIFTDDTPSSNTAYRLNIASILRLKMIMLLKDEYRVRGLQRILGAGEGYVAVTKERVSPNELANPNEEMKKIEYLTKMMSQIMNSGLFEMVQEDDEVKLVISETYKKVALLEDTSSQQGVLEELRKQTEGLVAENKQLAEELQKLKENRKEDVAVRIQEKRIESKVQAELKKEALSLWAKKNTPSFFDKLLHSDRIAQERDVFVEQYLSEQLNDRLEEALKAYHDIS